jgi:hypothetical protein
MRAHEIELTLARSNELLLQLCKHGDDSATIAAIAELTRIRHAMISTTEYEAAGRIAKLEKKLQSLIPAVYKRVDSPTSITAQQFEDVEA